MEYNQQQLRLWHVEHSDPSTCQKTSDFRKSIAFIIEHESVANNKIKLQGDQQAHCTLDRLFKDHLSEVHLSEKTLVLSGDQCTKFNVSEVILQITILFHDNPVIYLWSSLINLQTLFTVGLTLKLLNSTVQMKIPFSHPTAKEETIASLVICGCHDIQRTTLDDHNFVLLISVNTKLTYEEFCIKFSSILTRPRNFHQNDRLKKNAKFLFRYRESNPSLLGESQMTASLVPRIKIIFYHKIRGWYSIVVNFHCAFDMDYSRSIAIGGKKNGHKSIYVYADSILGVFKKKNGDLQYLIRFKTTNDISFPDSFIDSFIMNTIYPQMVIEYYENIMTWE
ncbi:hypothetical protein AGLY_014303 [Aphis glycines]|uniref:Chromo shadow domain-containing protein n=1 Tax=Aphis glycines TaxID=307491 RepID=A0A6G0T4G8_APHGL|nr:hypothetical protein AGLY_014303 [Aphis glycines]